jgi:hypothetical protein
LRACDREPRSSLSRVTRTHPAPPSSQLTAQPAARAGSQIGLPSVRALLATGAILLCPVGLAACGGGGNASDAIPKSTPEIIPPTDTSAEKASVQTTSTSTTSTAKSSEGSSSEEAASSEAESSSAGSESGASESSAATGGASSETAKNGGAESATKAGGESAATPSGGASAPAG